MDENKIKIRSSIVINAHSDQVWEVIKDHKNWNQWTAIAHSGTGNIAPDSTITVSFNTADGVVSFERQVITYEDGKVFGWSGDAFRGLKDYHHFVVETLEDGQTRFTQTDGFWGAEFDGLEILEEETKQGYDMMNDHLKKYIESKYPKVV